MKRVLGVAACLVAGLGGCEVESADRGEQCLRTAQCAAGLACVDGECTDDLSAVADGNTIPMTGEGDGDGDGDEGAAGDAGVGDAAQDEPRMDAALGDAG